LISGFFYVLAFCIFLFAPENFLTISDIPV
jgi:hypothetical protein